MAITPRPKNNPGCFGLLVAVAAVGIATYSPTPLRAQAKIDLSEYDGPAMIATGTGGTKITKHGIDYWTSGTPPRRYQVIGLISDKRDETWDGGHAIGSPKVASKVKEAGGDAVILRSQDEAGSTGGSGFWGIFAMGGSKTITQMAVIRYLPDEPVPAPTG